MTENQIVCCDKKNPNGYICKYCYTTYCDECKNEECELCSYLQNDHQIFCKTCNGIVHEFNKTLCYDCFIIATTEGKISYCYDCVIFFLLPNNNEKGKHHFHITTINRTTIFKMAVQKYKKLKRAFTLLKNDEDYVMI